VKAEARAPKLTRGSVAAVLVPQRPDSAGAQFFVVLADQPSLDNQYTVFGQVSDGFEVLQKISEAPVDEKRMVTERIEIKHVTIRDTPAEPFVTETPQQLAGYRAVLDTSAGPIAIEFLVDKAPETVAAVHAPGGLRRLQRDGVPPRRARVRHPDRRPLQPARCR
jgi:cyclophilin family peptidyl-prolyl cis-trans isomerase